MSEQPRDRRPDDVDPDADPDMVNPRDVRRPGSGEPDPDADPDQVSPRGGSQAAPRQDS